MILSMIIVVLSMKVSVTFFAAIQLLSRTSWRQNHTLFLAFFLCSYGIISVNELFISMGGYNYYPHFLGLTFPIKLLLAPALYFYARAITSEQNYRLKYKDFPALLAPFIAVLVAMPYYLLSANEKIALMSATTRNIELYERAILGCQIGLVLFLIVSFIYLFAAFRLFKDHAFKIREIFSRVEDKTLSWLRWVTLVSIVGWSVYAIVEILALSGIRSSTVYGTYQLFEFIWITLVAFFGIRQQAVYTAQPEDNINVSTESYSNMALDEQQLQQIAQQLNLVMEQKNLYMDPDLSLRELSTAIAIRENKISETFSRYFSKNFYDYVNGYRIQKACLLLKDSDLNILTIGMEVGFNSRSTFNSAFKRLTGQTPSQYRKTPPLQVDPV